MSTRFLTLAALAVLFVGCRPRPATGPQVHQGSLADGDQTLPSGEYGDLYQVEVQAGQWVTVEMTSSAFDPYLVLRSPSNNPTENDDASDGRRDARVRQQATESGTWTVVATSAQAGETGAYTLTIAVGDAGPEPEAPRPAEDAPERLAPVDTGVVTDTTPVFVVRPGRAPSAPRDEASPPDETPGKPIPSDDSTPTRTLRGVLEKGDDTLASGEYTDVLELPLQRGQRVRIDLESDDFDAYLIVQAPSGEQVDDDDRDGTTNARIEHTAKETGTYRVSFTTAQVGETGPYRARIRVE